MSQLKNSTVTCTCIFLMVMVTKCWCRVLVDSSACTGAGVRAVARRSYAARGGREVSVAAGQLVHLARRLDYHWYLGRTTSVSGGGGEQVDSVKYFSVDIYYHVTRLVWSPPPTWTFSTRARRAAWPWGRTGPSEGSRLGTRGRRRGDNMLGGFCYHLN